MKPATESNINPIIADTYCFLQPSNGTASKTFVVDGESITLLNNYSSGFLFVPIIKYIPDLKALADIFSDHDLKSFMVLGWPAGDPAALIRRLKRPRPNEEYGNSYLRDTLIRFFPIDVDGFDGTVIDFIAMLPEQFHSAGYVLLYSSSHGIKPGLRCHLFYQLATPLYVSDILDISKFINHDYGSRLLDTAIYQPQQPFYCAQPSFFNKEGLLVPDILRSRVSVVPGSMVDVEWLSEMFEERWERTKLVPPPTDESRYTQSGCVSAALVSIGTDGHHLPGYWYACCLARAGMSENEIIDFLRIAFKNCNRMGKLEDDFRSTYLSESYLRAQSCDAVREAK